MKILAVGGGSGGHVTPIVAVLTELVESIDEPIEVRFVCDRSFEKQARKILAEAAMPVEVSVISAGKLRRYKHFRWIDYVKSPSIMWRNSIDAFKTIWGTIESLGILLRFKPAIVFAKGGFVCLPIGFAARILNIPLVIHDSDARPGLTNRILAPHARAIATGYPLENYTYNPEKSFYTGVPVRDGYRKYSVEESAKLKRSLGFDPNKPLVVAIGGGLGAAAINHAMHEASSRLIESGVQALVVSGVAQYDTMQAKFKKYSPNVRVVDFISTGMNEVLGAADIVVTRASATALQELAALSKPTIAIPSRALSDQHKNADVYAANNAVIALTDDQLEAGELPKVLIELMEDVKRREKLANSIHVLAKIHAARDVALLIRDNAKR